MSDGGASSDSRNRFTPDQWERIKDLFQECLEMDPLERGPYLDHNAGSDPPVRAEVERLIRFSGKGASLLDEPVFKTSSSASVPVQISHYRLLSCLGTGGMGTVYEAADEILNRKVAIKLLRPGNLSDPDRKKRFIQEARAASALNHPGIVTIYEIGTESGFNFIAMELVAGKTLRDALARKRLPLRQALDYAIQIADALAAAHQAGIVHRDLKPANVMIADQGVVKVLDFGLAKLTEPVSDRTDSAESSAITLEGVLAGTAAYMSPEQAELKKIDQRSDIFSFGSVLYEMLTGSRAFAGQSEITILSKVIHTQPAPIAQSATDVPAELDAIVQRCLRKEPNRRFQHMADVRVCLEDVRESLDLPRESPPTARRTSRFYFAGAVAGILVAGLLLIAAMAFSGRLFPPPAPETRLTRLTTDPWLTAYPALSRDGKLLAYASDRSGDGNLDIWVQQLGDSSRPIRVTNDPADDSDPSFSPDGTSIVFRSERNGGGVYVISALGGDARLIAANGRNPRFSPDGQWIAYWVGYVGGEFLPGSARILIAPLAGSVTRAFRPDIPNAAYPVWSPDGESLLFLGRAAKAPSPKSAVDWLVARLDGGVPVATGALYALASRDLNPVPGNYKLFPGAWMPSTNSVLFSARHGDATNVWELPLSRETHRVAGLPRRRTSGTNFEVQPSAATGVRNSPVAFSSLNSTVSVWSIASSASSAPASEMQRVTQGQAFVTSPSVSADGKKLVFASSRLAGFDVVLMDVATGVQRALITLPGIFKPRPKISGDGRVVAYLDNGQGFLIDAAGGVPDKICERCGPPTHVSFDGRQVLFEPADEPERIIMAQAGSTHTTEIVRPHDHPEYKLFGGRFSPDQRWVAFYAVRAQSPATQIFVTPFRPAQPPSENEWIPITDDRAQNQEPYWSPDGTTIYYLSERDGFRCIWRQNVDRITRLRAGPPAAVCHFHYSRRLLKGFSAYTGDVGLSASGARLFFAMAELTGNIWMAADATPGGSR